MKLFAKILLTILFIPVFLALLVLISIRFQLLNSDFWIETYDKNDTYQKLETAIPKIIKRQGDGGVEGIASLLTKENLKITFEKNIKYTLDYVSGKSSSWTIFIPKDRLPKGLLPNFLLDSDEIPVETLISFFSRGREGAGAMVVPPWVPLIGKFTWIALAAWGTVAVLFGLVLFRLKPVSAALITSGAVMLILGGAATLFRLVIETEWAKEGEPSQLLLGTLGVPILAGMVKLWLVIAAFTVLSGIVLAYLSKKRVK